MVTMTKAELKELRQLLKEFCAKVESGGMRFSAIFIAGLEAHLLELPVCTERSLGC